MDDTTQTTVKRSFNPMIIVAVVAVLLLAGIGFFMLQGQNTNNTPQQTQNTQIPEGTTDTTQTSPAVSDTSTQSGEATATVQTFNIEAGSFYFNPKEIRVKQGDTVKIVLTSKDMMHNFVIDELGVDMPVVQSGNTGEVEFTADQKGTFEFYCSVGQHRKMGQVGTLIVE